MKKLCLLAFALSQMGTAEQAKHYLLTYQLAPGLDATHLTPQQMAVFVEHGKYLATFKTKGLVLGGRTEEAVGTLAIVVLAADEATAKAAVAQDPATKAGYLTGAAHPFNLLMPPELPAALVSDTKMNYDAVSRYLIEAAKKMPDDGYSFRPTPDVRSFAEVVGHIAEAQYPGCSVVRGEEYKPRNIEKSLATKADLVAALEQAVAYCQESWAKLTPGALADTVKLFGRERTKLGVMDVSTGHAFEHYGNMVTYLRLKGIVPPSSER